MHPEKFFLFLAGSVIGLVFLGAAFLIWGVVAHNQESSRVAFEAWKRANPKADISREEFDALSHKNMLKLDY